MKMLIKLQISEVGEDELTVSTLNSFTYNKKIQCDDYLSLVSDITSLIRENSMETFE